MKIIVKKDFLKRLKRKIRQKKVLSIIIFSSLGVVVFTASILIIRAVSNRGEQPYIYLKMDEGYGTSTVNAISGTGLSGTITGATWANEDDCITGKCLYFDGDNDSVSIPDFGLE